MVNLHAQSCCAFAQIKYAPVRLCATVKGGKHVSFDCISKHTVYFRIFHMKSCRICRFYLFRVGTFIKYRCQPGVKHKPTIVLNVVNSGRFALINNSITLLER